MLCPYTQGSNGATGKDPKVLAKLGVRLLLGKRTWKRKKITYFIKNRCLTIDVRPVIR